ncbi:hypothetical protein GCM10023238_32540 [Streptomyces heliomycini]
MASQNGITSKFSNPSPPRARLPLRGASASPHPAPKEASDAVSPPVPGPSQTLTRRPRAFAAGAAFLGAQPAQPAEAATVDPNASYVLVNRNSGKALDVYNMATDDGARITQWTRNDQNQQQWQFVDSGNATTASSPATRARC